LPWPMYNTRSLKASGFMVLDFHHYFWGAQFSYRKMSKFMLRASSFHPSWVLTRRALSSNLSMYEFPLLLLSFILNSHLELAMLDNKISELPTESNHNEVQVLLAYIGMKFNSLHNHVKDYVSGLYIATIHTHSFFRSKMASRKMKTAISTSALTITLQLWCWPYLVTPT
jgi:hypothetical protein